MGRRTITRGRHGDGADEKQKRGSWKGWPTSVMMRSRVHEQQARRIGMEMGGRGWPSGGERREEKGGKLRLELEEESERESSGTN
jgi:hypothetical protein